MPGDRVLADTGTAGVCLPVKLSAGSARHGAGGSVEQAPAADPPRGARLRAAACPCAPASRAGIPGGLSREPSWAGFSHPHATKGTIWYLARWSFQHGLKFRCCQRDVHEGLLPGEEQFPTWLPLRSRHGRAGVAVGAVLIVTERQGGFLLILMPWALPSWYPLGYRGWYQRCQKWARADTRQSRAEIS